MKCNHCEGTNISKINDNGIYFCHECKEHSISAEDGILLVTKREPIMEIPNTFTDMGELHKLEGTYWQDADDDVYIFAQTMSNKFSLICLRTGNRYAEPSYNIIDIFAGEVDEDGNFSTSIVRLEGKLILTRG